MKNNIQLPGYTIDKEIGRGGMSKVYRAHQHNFDMYVALKVMDTSLLRNPEFGTRFFEEARTMRRLHHPNIVVVNDVGRHGDYFYLSMEYLEGGDLKDRLKSGLAPEDSLKIITEIAAALDYIHKQGFVHRDIKPENVLFRKDGTSILTDFGIARAVEGANHLTKTGMVIGTPNYMSPEQARGQTVDFRSDIYGLGILFFEILTGDLPYTGNSSVAVCLKHLNEPIPELTGDHARFQSIVNRAMAKKPEDRYATCSELASEMARHMGAAHTGAVHTGIRHTAGKSDPVLTPTVIFPRQTGSRNPDVAPGRGNNRKLQLATLAVLMSALGLYAFWPPSPAPLGADLISEQVKAESLIAATRYIESDKLPEAEASFRTVLALDAGNEEALEGLHRIGEIFLAKAKQEMAASEFTRAGLSLASVLRVYPEHPELREVQTSLLDQSYEKSRTERLAQEQAAFIARTLSQADQAMEEGRWINPPGDNALDLFHKVFAVDAQNPSARNGIDLIAAHFLQLSESAIAAQDFPSARSSLMLVIRIAPGADGVGRVQKQLDSALEAQEKTLEEQQRHERERKEVIALSESADLDLLQGRLLSPDGNNAYEKYQQILLLDNANAVAHQGLNQIGRQLLELALDTAEAGEFERSDNLFVQALSIAPGSTLSDEFQKKIQAAKRDFEHLADTRKTIQDLLTQAGESLRAGSTFEPADTSAYRKYISVLELDSGDRAARDGLLEVGQAQIRKIGDLIRNGMVDEAEKQLQFIIAYMPTHPGVSEIQESLAVAKENRAVAQLLRREAEDRNVRVTSLLAEAGADLKEDYLRRSYAKFTEVLRLERDNQQARLGIAGINQRYQQLIDLAIERSNYDDANVYLRGLKETDLDGTAYRLAQQQVDDSRAALELFRRGEEAQDQRRQTEITQLLDQADRFANDKRLIETGQQGAYFLYKQVLVINPGNERALEGMTKIYEDYFSRIQELVDQEKFTEAEEVLSEITNVDPADRRITPQRIALSKAKAEKLDAD